MKKDFLARLMSQSTMTTSESQSGRPTDTLVIREQKLANFLAQIYNDYKITEQTIKRRRGPDSSHVPGKKWKYFKEYYGRMKKDIAELRGVTEGKDEVKDKVDDKVDAKVNVEVKDDYEVKDEAKVENKDVLLLLVEEARKKLAEVEEQMKKSPNKKRKYVDCRAYIEPTSSLH